MTSTSPIVPPQDGRVNRDASLRSPASTRRHSPCPLLLSGPNLHMAESKGQRPVMDRCWAWGSQASSPAMEHRSLGQKGGLGGTQHGHFRRREMGRSMVTKPPVLPRPSGTLVMWYFVTAALGRYIQPSVSTGLAFKDSTNCRWKIFFKESQKVPKSQIWIYHVLSTMLNPNKWSEV